MTDVVDHDSALADNEAHMTGEMKMPHETNAWNHLALRDVLKLCAILGAGSGVVFAPFTAIQYWQKFDLIWLIVITLSVPPVNGILMMLYGLLGYWLYRFLVGSRVQPKTR